MARWFWAVPLAMLVAAAPIPARADVACSASTGMTSTCTTTAAGPASASRSSAPSRGSGECRNAAGEVVPCRSAGGNWSAEHQCYVSPVPVQLLPTDGTFWAALGGRDAGTHYWCDAGRSGKPMFWLPAGAAPGPSPAVLAQQAVDSMQLRAAGIGLTPPPGSPNPTLVGIPTWMWIDEPTATTYGPATASASAAGITVTATARVTSITWDMGDGVRVQCGAGTPYTPGYRDRPSPTCGHRYRKPGQYTVTATSHWAVDWRGGGQTGRIMLDLTSSTVQRVAEAFALVVTQE
jgi:hypothetical protein